MYDAIIVGSGVIGMSVARTMSELGMHIAVVDRDVPGMHASYKAGGMLGAQNEFTEESSLFHIAQTSRSMFEDLRNNLLDEVGVDIEYLSSGLIKMAANLEDNASVIQQYQFLHQHDDSVKMLSSEGVSQLSNGGIISDGLSAIHIPNDHQINANQYTKALLKSLSHRHIHRIYNTEVHNIECHHLGGYRVVTKDEVLLSEKVIVAGGAWSGKLLNNYMPRNKVSGIKGEALLVEHTKLDLKTTLFMTNGCYIIPKMNQRYLIGATSYMDDFSVGVSESGKQWLLTQAIQYMPRLKESQLLKQWSGIRPYCTNEQPIMDEVDKGLFVITGHYRNGILLSPYIGSLMGRWIQSGHRPTQLEDFQFEGSQKNEMYHKR